MEGYLAAFVSVRKASWSWQSFSISPKYSTDIGCMLSKDIMCVVRSVLYLIFSIDYNGAYFSFGDEVSVMTIQEIWVGTLQIMAFLGLTIHSGVWSRC